MAADPQRLGGLVDADAGAGVGTAVGNAELDHAVDTAAPPDHDRGHEHGQRWSAERVAAARTAGQYCQSPDSPYPARSPDQVTSSCCASHGRYDHSDGRVRIRRGL